ncbi:tetratricopeptide repeat protein [Gaetbulibacter aquiaggeris]|uniref:Tetratricopeptide repeat protein n=1 Tax=Gaetbulibacter aquiaggeris TaxID=1735373 RepID=A0ABW7MWS2_9FLAO
MRAILFCLFTIIVISGCSKNVQYSEEFKEKTAGRYLFNSEVVIDVYFENNDLFLKWQGEKVMKPIILDENTFFVADMYKKFHFVEHPQTKKHYLSILDEDDENVISYDYLKVSDSFKTPSMYLENKEFDKALLGYLDIQKQDSTSVFINEIDFNRKGYELLREKKYQDAINVFKINVALYPKSDNVYDSLADAYLRNGDSLLAFNNYKKALELNTGNDRAKEYIKKYSKNK